MAAETPTSPEQWLRLPEISFPTIESAAGKGSVYTLHKVGFALATPAECDAAGIRGEIGPAGKCVLPTTLVDFGGEPELCRLPLSLARWAFDCVALAQSGQLGFPTPAEFGILSGRPYVELL